MGSWRLSSTAPWSILPTRSSDKRCHDRAGWSCALCGDGRRRRRRFRLIRRRARIARAGAGHGRRSGSAVSRRRRALALRASPLAEILPMRRSHRSVHRALWPVLALAVALGLAMALVLRPPPKADAPQMMEELKP